MPTLSLLETDPSKGHPGHTGRSFPSGRAGSSLTCLAGISPPPCRAVAAAWLDTAPSILAWWLAYCCGWGRSVTNSGSSPDPHGWQQGGVPRSQGEEALGSGFEKQQVLCWGLESGMGCCFYHAGCCEALTCSTGTREPTGPLPARAAGIARPGRGWPRASSVGSPVDGPVGWQGQLRGAPHGLASVGAPGLLGPGQAFPRHAKRDTPSLPIHPPSWLVWS